MTLKEMTRVPNTDLQLEDTVKRGCQKARYNRGA